MKIAGVRIKGTGLLADRIDHVRMAVTHVSHIVVHVEVFPAIGIEQPDAFTAHKMQWLIVKQPIGGAHQLLSSFEKL